MALGKTITQVITSQTIAASSSYTQATGTDLSSAVDFGVGYTLTFNAAATLGARIDVFADPAGASASFTVGAYDDAADSADVAVDAGHTVSGFVQMMRSAKFVKVRIVNLDTGQSITGASAWVQVQAP